MSQPPPYPGDEKSGYPAAPPNPAYPPPAHGFSNMASPLNNMASPPSYSAATQQPGLGYGGTSSTVKYQQPNAIFVQPTNFSVIQQYHESPVRTTCPYCQAEVITATRYDVGTITWVIALVLCLVGLSLGCCLIPFCVDGCKDVIHSCPNCRQTISRFTRMSQAGYAPPPAGYPQPPPQGFVPPTGYAQPPPGGYAPPPQGYGPPQQGYGPPPQGYAPPPQGYAPAPGQQYGQTTVVVAQPTMSVVQQFRETPVHTRCPHCSAEIVTAAHYETGSLTWIICLVLCLVGCDFGCCLIPFCVDGCKDVIHSCPNCRQTISRYSRM